MANDKEDLRRHYLDRIKKGLTEQAADKVSEFEEIESRQYTEFKKELLPKKLSYYEKGCQWAEKLLKIKADPKKSGLVIEAIQTCHLDVTPDGVLAFSILFPLLVMVVGGLLGYVLPILLGGEPTIFFVVFFLLVGLIFFYLAGKLPFFLAKSWRLAASNQMIQCIFFIVTYMRHTSNLENAIDFAAEHLVGPLALDMKKILWDVETERYESVRESLDVYLVQWRETNSEFVEAFNLIQSSLLESEEARRLELIDKSLDAILSETYEKMLRYAHDLHSPLTMLHMLGIIMPILGLVILPLMVSIMEGIRWYYIATLYNIVLPIAVYLMGRNILAERPTGYGDTDISEINPELKKLKKIKLPFTEKRISPIYLCVILAVVFVIIGLAPVYLGSTLPQIPGSDIPSDICITQNFKSFNPAVNLEAKPLACLLDYRPSTTKKDVLIGPFGLGASLFSVFVVLGFGLAFGIYFAIKSRGVIDIRNKTKKLESEFTNGLFLLGNRLADGLPTEIALGKVSQTLEGTETGKFFSIVVENITRLGMSVSDAIFNRKIGALLFFPSAVIESSMKVLVEASKKGPRIAAQALMNVSRYIKEIHNVDERLKDLMAEIISDMKTQVRFLAPAISGVVVGITSMITFILGRLNLAQATGGIGEVGGLANIFSGDTIPTYFFQIIVGIYVVQLIYILTTLSNKIENGEDKLNEQYELGRNMVKGTLMYCLIAAFTMMVFSILAAVILQKGIAG
ncbi:hypothetical protein KY340_00140 [Candidatus Woesearchaeota archaeon]|nr:hypothetical protein [Candidatus Woesearchaeota archaeon]